MLVCCSVCVCVCAYLHNVHTCVHFTNTAEYTVAECTNYADVKDIMTDMPSDPHQTCILVAFSSSNFVLALME